MSEDLLKRLDSIIGETNIAIDKMDPDGREAGLLFEPIQDLGWAVDELLGRHKRKDVA